MKNYAINKYQEKSFILNYKIDGDKIIVNLASKDNYSLPYTKENEIMILERMKEQILSSGEYYVKLKKKEKIYLIITCIIGLVTIYLFNIYGINAVTMIMDVYFFKRIYGFLCVSKNVDDIKKNRLFLKNIELFKNVSEVKLSGVSKKTKKIIKEHNLTLNDMDNVYYSDIDLIIDNYKHKKLVRR